MLADIVARAALPDEVAPALADDPEWVHRLAEAAIGHRVAGSLAAALRDAGVDQPDLLRAAIAASSADHLRIMRALARIAPALEDAGLRWAVVKGPALAARWPGPATARSYQDLDLLVDPRSIRDAVAVLESLGFEHRNHNWTGFEQLGVGELPLAADDVVIDLHWHLVGLLRDRRTVNVPTAEMLDRVVPLDLAGTVVPTTSDLDTLVHLCLHDALAGVQSLVELRDLHLVASAVSATEARRRLAEARVGRLAAVALDRAERTFGPLGPTRMSAALTGAPGWILVNRAVDEVWSALRPSAWSPFPGSVARAGRSSLKDMAVAVVSELRRSAAVRLGRPTVVSPGGPLDWTVDAGGPAGRERYFDAVVSGRFGR